MVSVTDGETFRVTVPNHREVKRGTLSDIIADSGLPRTLFQTK